MRMARVLPAALALAACSTAVPTETPGVSRLGKAVLEYKGPEIEAVIGYRFAAASIGDPWLIIDLAVTGATGDSVQIDRDRVWLRTEEGDIVPLPSQDEFATEYSHLTSTIRRADIAADPLDYWSGRAACALQFLVAPGSAIALPSIWVNDRRVCSGRLFFAPPHGVQPGHYTLGIDLEESKVRIPFELRGPG
jgi:hypothetical protein